MRRNVTQLNGLVKQMIMIIIKVVVMNAMSHVSIIAQCLNNHCKASRYVACGAGLCVSREFGQVVKVNLSNLVPGGSNGMVELQYHVNLPYRQNAESRQNTVILENYRFGYER